MAKRGGISFDIYILGKTSPIKGLMPKTLSRCWHCQRRSLSGGGSLLRRHLRVG